MEEDPRRRGLKVTCMLLPATTCTGSYLFLTQTAWPLKKQHLRGKTDFRDGVFSPPQSSEDKKLSSGCHLPSIIYCSTKEPFYFFWLSAKEPNEKLIHLAWHPAWPKEQKQKKKKLFCHIWTYQNLDHAPILGAEPGPALCHCPARAPPKAGCPQQMGLSSIQSFSAAPHSMQTLLSTDPSISFRCFPTNSGII